MKTHNRKKRGNYDMDDGVSYFKSNQSRKFRRIGGTVERVVAIKPDRLEPASLESSTNFWVFINHDSIDEGA